MDQQQQRFLQDDGTPPAGPGIFIIVFVTIFFLIWNSIMAINVVGAISGAFRGNFSGLLILVCPHWLAGLIMPVFICGMLLGTIGTAVALIVPIGIPYTCAIVYFNCGFHNWPDADSDSDDSDDNEQPVGHVPESDIEVVHNADDMDIEMAQPAVAPSAPYETDPILEKLILKKVVKHQPFSWTTSFTTSFRSHHPKTDIVASSVAESTIKDMAPHKDTAPNKDMAHNHICQQTHEPSERVCTICLEGYSVGQSVAWSKNEECHHVFHTDCIASWLRNRNGDCPVCRRAY